MHRISLLKLKASVNMKMLADCCQERAFPAKIAMQLCCMRCMILEGVGAGFEAFQENASLWLLVLKFYNLICPLKDLHTVLLFYLFICCCLLKTALQVICNIRKGSFFPTFLPLQ